VENPIESPIAARYVKDCRLRTHQFKRQSSKPYLMRIQRSHPRQTKSRLVILLNAFVVTAVVQTQRTGLAFFGSWHCCILSANIRRIWNGRSPPASVSTGISRSCNPADCIWNSRI